MKSNTRVYSIDLDIKSTAASKQALKELQTTYETSNKDINALNASYAELAKHTKDTTELEKQYNKVVSKRLSDRDEEIDKLKAEKVAIAANRDLTESQKEEMISLKDAEIKRLETDKKYIKAKEKEAKLLAKMNKLFHSNLDENSKSFKLAKNLVSMQEKLNKLIGKESALRKAATKAAIDAAKGLKIAGGAAIGLMGGLMGGAVAGAERTQQKADAMRSLKSGIGEETLDEIYVRTGADYQTIVAAINRVASSVDKKDVAKYAIAEIENPGLGALMLQQTKIDTGFDYRNALNQIRKITGVQDTSEIIDAVTKSQAVKNKRLSQFDHMQATAALSQLGLDGETIERIISDIAKHKGNKSFIDAFNSADLSKYVWDQGLKNTLSNANLKLQELDYTKRGLNETPEQKAARETAEELRRFELEKDKLLREILPGVLPLMKALMKLVQNVMPIILSALGSLVRGLGIVVKWAEDKLDSDAHIGEAMESAGESMKNAADEMREANERAKREAYRQKVRSNIEELSSFFENVKSNLPTFINNVKSNLPALSGGQNAQGGIVTAPSIVGEAGPELVLPLDYSRAGRASQIVQNFNTTQSFNMAANQQTPLAFSQAVGNNRFVTRVNGL